MQKSYNFLAKKISQPQYISKKMAASSFLSNKEQRKPNFEKSLLVQKKSSIIFELDEVDEGENEDKVEDKDIDEFMLHKTKIFKQTSSKKISSIRSDKFKLKVSSKIWDGKINEEAEPNIFLNKKNYQKLKEKFGKMIRDEILANSITEKSKEEKLLLNSLIPLPGRNHDSSKENRRDFQEDAESEALIKIKQLDNEITILDDEIFQKKEIYIGFI